MASLAYLVLYLCLHSCAARPLMVWDTEIVTQLRLSSKDVKNSVAERFVKHGDKALDHERKVMQLDNQKISSVKKAKHIEGQKIKTSYSWKILAQATGTEIWKNADRSMLESPLLNAEENVRSKDTDTVEDIVVMDYAQPHRKPPIHNKGT